MDGQLFQFMVLPNGYTGGPRKFTKLLKPVLASLRKREIPLAAFLDDLIIFGNGFKECRENILAVLNLLQELGFVINSKKSVFVPSTCLEFLGVVINSITMEVTLTEGKKVAIKELCSQTLAAKKVTIRHVARLLGKFSSSLVAVPEGKLHFRYLDKNKTTELIRRKGKFDKNMTLIAEAREEIHWWRENILDSYSPILRENPSITISTDASSLGWGASCEGRETGGLFTEEEKEIHINVLESKAVLFGLKSLCGHIECKHIKVLVDNTATVGAINNMGSSKSLSLHREIKEIWDWTLEQRNWITASHIPGVLNVEADAESRKNETRTEWKLNSELFHYTIDSLNFNPTIDIFASRTNTQLSRFFSYRPDPQAEVINAFTVDWHGIDFYAFPPFICIGRVLQKIRQDKATGILIVPDWANQNWYNIFSRMVIREILLSPREDLLHLPSDLKERHPLYKHLHLRAALVTGIDL